MAEQNSDQNGDIILENGLERNGGTDLEEDLEDYEALETELDKLDSCLTVVEGWNANLHSECVKRLERSRELRQRTSSQKPT